MPAKTTGTLILAAGGSTRFGGAKAAAGWGKTSLLGHAVETARTLGGPLLVVTGGHAAAVKPLLQKAGAGVEHIYNEQWQDGMGGSTALGIKTLLAHYPQLRQVIIMTVDQPLTRPAHLRGLLLAAQAQDRVALTSDGIHRGPPACVPARFFARAQTLSGERGLKSLLTSAEIVTIENKDAMRDCDTPQQLSILARKAES